MKEGLKLVVLNLVVSLCLAFFGAIVGTVGFVVRKKQLEKDKGEDFSSKNLKSRLYQVFLLLFASIFCLIYLLLHYFG